MFSAGSKKRKKMQGLDFRKPKREMENGQIKNLLNYSVDPDTDRA